MIFKRRELNHSTEPSNKLKRTDERLKKELKKEEKKKKKDQREERKNIKNNYFLAEDTQ